MSIGKRIRTIRKKLGFTQKELAEKSGLAEITIRQYEAEKRTPKIDALMKIGNAMDVAFIAFLDEEMGVSQTNHLMSKQRSMALNLSDEVYSSLEDEEIDILFNVRQLNKEGKEKVNMYSFKLLQNSKYRKHSMFGPK